ncbi:MAG: MarR family transcriptional regulator [Thermomicrobiales bacterium]|nr:MarR family transcriptional regulator [Thermomicrobiales bacterium]
MPTDRLTESLMMLWRELHLLSSPIEHGEITAQQYWLLRHLNLRGQSSIGELATALGISQSSTTTACKRLERDGLVRRARCADDERVVRVSLTDSGKAQIEAWRGRRREMLAHLLDPLEQSERDELQRVVDHVLEAAGVGEPRLLQKD